jgi:ATP-dependent exoDNAse (exonuclease V) beta subunit
MTQHPFSIFNASAGSGKTFTLVKAYLSILLASNKTDYFKHILAVTFTNKAVGEMKHRILESLIAFSKNPTPENHLAMFNLVCAETGLNEKEIRLRAQKAVQFILHHYSFFDVETIDRFNHRLIRTFARDLKLAANFDVELEVDLVLSEAVDKVISQVGIDEQLTKVILDFSFEKADDDKSWDISSDLKKISHILKNENDLKHFEQLKSKTITDFIELKGALVAKKLATENHLKLLSVEFFDALSKNGLEDSDFLGKYFPNYFKNIANGRVNVLTGAGWQQNFGSNKLYPNRVTGEKAATIDSLTAKFVSLFENSAQQLLQIGFLSLILQNVNALSLINAIYVEYLNIQTEKNILPISEFNTRINNEIKNQPAPFIYERLGEKYRHYFIDEFQDTSQMQWNNLIPLIENALSQSAGDQLSGSLLLVGDAKQSIYRWRGGDPDQFIGLYEKFNPFPSVGKTVRTLDTNYRSYDEIISFNNAFFSFVASTFTSGLHNQLYETGNSQKTTSKEGGYVSIEFLDPKSEDDKNTVYQERTEEIIRSLIDQNYNLSDICILVRTNSQGVALAEFLSKKNIKIISSEALLLESAPEIVFIIDLFKTIQNFEDKKARADVFYFLHNHLEIEQPLSDFLMKMLSIPKTEISKTLETFGVNFSFEFSSGIPLFDLCENICNSFSLSKKRVAYLQSFLELVFEFSSKESNTIPSFLDFWEDKKSKSSVEISDQINAVTIMTVHKSKGLEFPVVIYPFADDDIVTAHKEKLWLPIDENEFNGFSEMLVPAKKEIENYGEINLALYEEVKMKSELDTLNIVYVAMTRAIEQLYVLTDINSIEKENKTASIFYLYLKETKAWDNTNTFYEFGITERFSEASTEDGVIKTITAEKFPENNPYTNIIKIATKKALLWNTEKEKAIEKGDLLHEILAEIFTENDKESVLQKFIFAGIISEIQAKEIDVILTDLVSHQDLKEYFKPSSEAFNEKEIFTQTGESLRPDRINFTGNDQVTIIDYKTGTEKPEHRNQIKSYAEVLTTMGFIVHQMLLVYIKEKVEIIVVN